MVSSTKLFKPSEAFSQINVAKLDSLTEFSVRWYYSNCKAITSWFLKRIYMKINKN